LLRPPAALPDDPKRPVMEISRDLDIQPDQFRACFANVSPHLPVKYQSLNAPVPTRLFF
jgi:hypothetical protein